MTSYVTVQEMYILLAIIIPMGHDPKIILYKIIKECWTFDSKTSI